MPPGYRPFDWKSDPDFPPTDSSRESGDLWEHTLGSWWLIAPSQRGQEHLISSFAIWIGPTGEYPTAGVSPAPRQVDLTECRLPVSGVDAHLVIYTLQDSAGTRTRYVSAPIGH